MDRELRRYRDRGSWDRLAPDLLLALGGDGGSGRGAELADERLHVPKLLLVVGIGSVGHGVLRFT